jgi:hypothetical protein
MEGSAGGEADESTEGLGLDDEINPRPGFLSHHRQHPVARRAVDLEALGLNKFVCLRRPLVGAVEVEIHGIGVGEDPNEGHLGFLLVDIALEEDRIGLPRLEQRSHFSGELLEPLELALLDPVGADKDDRLRQLRPPAFSQSQPVTKERKLAFCGGVKRAKRALTRRYTSNLDCCMCRRRDTFGLSGAGQPGTVSEAPRTRKRAGKPQLAARARRLLSVGRYMSNLDCCVTV